MKFNGSLFVVKISVLASMVSCKTVNHHSEASAASTNANPCLTEKTIYNTEKGLFNDKGGGGEKSFFAFSRRSVTSHDQRYREDGYGSEAVAFSQIKDKKGLDYDAFRKLCIGYKYGNFWDEKINLLSLSEWEMRPTGRVNSPIPTPAYVLSYNSMCVKAFVDWIDGTANGKIRIRARVRDIAGSKTCVTKWDCLTNVGDVAYMKECATPQDADYKDQLFYWNPNDHWKMIKFAQDPSKCLNIKGGNINAPENSPLIFYRCPTIGRDLSDGPAGLGQNSRFNLE